MIKLTSMLISKNANILTSLKLSILANGWVECVTVKAKCNGQMARITKVHGSIIKPLVKEFSTMKMVILIQAIGLITKPMVKEPTSITMALSMKDNGRTTSNADLAEKLGSKELFLKAITRTE